MIAGLQADAAGRAQPRPLAESIRETFDLYLAEGTESSSASVGMVDAGPAVLAAAWDEHPASAGFDAEGIFFEWLDRAPAAPGLLSAFAGAGALLHGLGSASWRCPALRPFHERVRQGLLDAIEPGGLWSNPAADWQDYDLVFGPAGLMLVLCADADADPSALAPLASHLIALLASREMESFRLPDSIRDERRRWNARHINLGLAHGVPGPIAALTAYIRRGGAFAEPAARAIAQAGTWLIEQAHEDELGLLTWGPRRPDGSGGPLKASRREAWCYGAPATAWVLWDAGQAVSDERLRSAGAEAFERYEKAFDPEFHLTGDPREQLAVCHGAAGILQIADGFERHCGLTAAARLAARLEEYLHARLAEVTRIAASDSSLQSGAMGILATLLTRAGGDRRWLPLLALR